MQNGLRQYLSFLEQRIQEEHKVVEEVGTFAARQKEICYRRAEGELRRLFPEIDFYGRIEDIQL